MSGVIGAILAGGEASRLGRPKATAPLGGRPLIEHPLAALRDAGLEPVVVAKPGTALPAIDATVWREEAEPVHPLLGVVTALERAEGRPVLVCGCDLPFVTAPLAKWIAAHDARLAVPRVGGRLQPLFALYAPQVITQLREALAALAPLQETLAALDPLILAEAELEPFGDPERLLFNVNTASDLARAEEMLPADDQALETLEPE